MKTSRPNVREVVISAVNRVKSTRAVDAYIRVTAVGEQDDGAVFQTHYARHARVDAAWIDDAHRAAGGALHADAALVPVAKAFRAFVRFTCVILSM